jgi:hypothetical protein
MAPPWRRREKATDRSKIDATPPWEVRQRDEPEPTTSATLRTTIGPAWTSARCAWPCGKASIFGWT